MDEGEITSWKKTEMESKKLNPGMFLACIIIQLNNQVKRTFTSDSY